MKKLITIAAALFASASLFAFDLKLGARLSDDLNIYDFKCGDLTDDLWNDDILKLNGPIDGLKPANGFGVNVYANIALPFLKGLSVQPEVGFHYHNIAGKGNSLGSLLGESLGDYDDFEAHYMTLDIPVIVAYRIDVTDMFFIQPELGPRFSFTLGNIVVDNYPVNKNGLKFPKDDIEPNSPFNIGLEAGVTFGINVGPGSIVINARYSRDFTRTEFELNMGEVSTLDYDYKRDKYLGAAQSVNVSVGYQIRIM